MIALKLKGLSLKGLIIHVFIFIGNQVAKDLNVKNGLKFKNIPKQSPTLKTLM